MWNDNVHRPLPSLHFTVFAYGQTGCGKSFTMQGINDPPSQKGIIPRYNRQDVQVANFDFDFEVQPHEFTFFTPALPLTPPSSVLPLRFLTSRAFEHIFEAIAVAETTKYLVHGSYCEIYNEEIRDLLGKNSKAKLDLKEHPEKGVYVQGLTSHAVNSVAECKVLMEKGTADKEKVN